MKQKFSTMETFLHSILFRYWVVFNLFGKYGQEPNMCVTSMLKKSNFWFNQNTNSLLSSPLLYLHLTQWVAWCCPQKKSGQVPEFCSALEGSRETCSPFKSQTLTQFRKSDGQNHVIIKSPKAGCCASTGTSGRLNTWSGWQEGGLPTLLTSFPARASAVLLPVSGAKRVVGEEVRVEGFVLG